MKERLSFETASVGELIGPMKYAVPADYNERRLGAYAMRQAHYIDTDAADEIAEPSFLCGQHAWLMRQRYSWEGSVHAKCEIEYYKPITLGSTFSVTGQVLRKYQRRGGYYVVFDLRTVDADGQPICSVQNTMLLNFKEVSQLKRQASSIAGTTEISSSSPPVAEPNLSYSFGPKVLHRDDILRFFRAEEDIYGLHPNIHNTESIAKAAGLADIIAPGRYSIGLINCMFAKIYGPRFLYGAKYSVSFLQNLLPGIEPQIETRAVERNGKFAPREFEITCRDARSGKVILAGNAKLPL